MTLKEDFFKELEKREQDPDAESTALLWYDVANQLSLKNAGRYNRCIIGLAICGVVFAFCFLIYFSVLGLNNYNILALLTLLLVIIVIYGIATKRKYHRKYLEYRVLAESLRVQNYVSKAGVDKKISEMLPLLVRNDIGWIKEIMDNLPETTYKKESIVGYWINYQRDYHINALKKAHRKKKLYDTTSDAINLLTVVSYFAILILELFLLNQVIVERILIFTPMDLKFYLGILSVFALLYSSIYGKMSLTEMISNNERMIMLYDNALEYIGEHGENEKIVLKLAEECLTENSLWYAFQKQNKVEMII